MVIRDPRRTLVMIVRLAEAARVRELQADEQAVERAERLAMGIVQLAQQRRQPGAIRLGGQRLIRIGPPVGCTAAASPPQMSFAPLRPKFRHRRSVCSDGEPSRLASQPSIGWMHQRLPTAKPANLQRRGQRRAFGGREHPLIHRHVEAQLREPRAKRRDVLQLGDLGIICGVGHRRGIELRPRGA